MKTKILLAGAFLFIAGMVQSASAEMMGIFVNNSKDAVVVTDLQDPDSNRNTHIIPAGGTYTYSTAAGFQRFKHKVKFGQGRGSANVEDTGTACAGGGYEAKLTTFDDKGNETAQSNTCIQSKRGSYYCVQTDLHDNNATVRGCN